ncbi:hypothetical protein DOI34_24915 [Salmonella enterica subsp. enterica serovar Virchow]|nr:hypothetical protein [Salmonella enterica subsp. enterica serovar Virchow]EBX4817076.1 hypothetical protein [Salmonella enterica subsp. enterica serovar Newport]MIL09396.1 hypothetical protein [Salmonella enterica subsp. enterica serovar Enteritidis]
MKLCDNDASIGPALHRARDHTFKLLFRDCMFCKSGSPVMAADDILDAIPVALLGKPDANGTFPLLGGRNSRIGSNCTQYHWNTETSDNARRSDRSQPEMLIEPQAMPKRLH